MRGHRPIRLIWAIVLLPLLLALALAGQGSPASKEVCVLALEGVINPISQRYIERGIDRAEREGAECVIVKLNTHGGLLDPMEKIVERFLAAKVPVVVYVAPAGAKADSAGCFITLAANIAAMAPNSLIGSASPITMSPGGGGGEDQTAADKNAETLQRKLMNHALSLMKNIARERGRNEQWALQAVREARSDTAADALKAGAIDVIAVSIPDLLQKIDGRTVKVAGREVTLATKGAAEHSLPMGPAQRLLFAISDINVAYILLFLGVYGLIYEFANPGAVLPGVAGAICLALALISLSSFPINYAGAFLLILGFGLLVADLLLPSHGALTIGGLVSLVFGSLMLVDVSESVTRVSYSVIAGAVGATGAFFAFAVGKGLLAQRRKVTTGSERLVGLTGAARSDLDPQGQVFVDGSYWGAVAEGEPIGRGEVVEVVRVEGLRLTVRRKTAPEPGAAVKPDSGE